MTGAITIQQTGIMNVLPSEVYFSESLGHFVVKRYGKYYNARNTQDKWMQPNTTTPYTEKQYILGSDIYMYDADDADLKQIGGSSSSGFALSSPRLFSSAARNSVARGLREMMR